MRGRCPAWLEGLPSLRKADLSHTGRMDRTVLPVNFIFRDNGGIPIEERSIIEQVADDRRKHDEDERRRYRMQQRIYELKNQGMDTTRLEKALKGDVDEAAKVFTEFDSKLGELAQVWNRLYTIDFRGFEAEYQEIYSQLRDPFAVDDLNKKLDRLENAVEKKHKEQMKAWKEEQEKREKELKKYNLAQVIMSYKARGYVVDELEKLLEEGDLDKTREAMAKFETEIRKLWEVGQRLNNIDARGLQTEYNEVRALLYDTTKLEEATTKVEILEKKAAERAKESGQSWQEQKAGKEQWEANRAVQVDQQLQAEARKAGEDRMKAEKAKEDWKRKLAEEKQAVAKTRLHVNRLANHWKEYTPQLSPLGLYLGDRKWAVEVHLDKLEVIGKANVGFFSDHLMITTRFISAAELPSVKDLVAYYKNLGKEAKGKGQYRVHCVMMNRLSRSTIGAVKEFKHSNCAALIYDVAEDKLHYNAKRFGTDIFAGYFNLDSRPKSLKEIFSPIEDKFEVIYQKDIGPKFGMGQSEVNRMMKHLLSTNQVYPVEKRKKSFSFA